MKIQRLIFQKLITATCIKVTKKYGFSEKNESKSEKNDTKEKEINKNHCASKLYDSRTDDME